MKGILNCLEKSVQAIGMTLNDESIVQAMIIHWRIRPQNPSLLKRKEKDGDYYPYAKLYDIEQIQGVQRYALYKARETAKQIVSGKLRFRLVKPAK